MPDLGSCTRTGGERQLGCSIAADGGFVLVPEEPETFFAWKNLCVS